MALKEKIRAVCHPEKDAWAHQLCRSCYDTVRKTGKLPTTLHGPERIAAEQFVQYVGNGRKKLHPSTVEPIVVKPAQIDEEKVFNTYDPRVAEHVAGAIVKSLLDYHAAARLLKPDFAPHKQAELAHALERDPNIHAAVQTELAKRGLGDEDKQRYISMLWQMAGDTRPQSEKLRLQSLRLLARVFLPEGHPTGSQKPEALPLAGIDEGMEKMGIGSQIDRQVSDGIAEVDPDAKEELDSEGE